MKLSKSGTSRFKRATAKWDISMKWHCFKGCPGAFFNSLNKTSSHLFSIYKDPLHFFTKCLSFNSSQHLKAQLSFDKEKNSLLWNPKCLLRGQRRILACLAPSGPPGSGISQDRMSNFYLCRPHGQHWASNIGSPQ